MSSLDVDALLGDVYNPNSSNDKKSGNDSKKDGGNREKDREREKEKEREKEREKKSRKRTRSPSPVNGEKERERKSKVYSELTNFDKSKDMLPKLSEEEMQAEQDSRTVFVSGLPTNAPTKDLYSFFERVGKVKDISLISDRNSKRSKGIGYIEYSDKSSIPGALGLSGTVLNGHTVIIQATMAEKNRLLATNITPSGPTRVYFSNIDIRLIEADLELFFEQCGEVKMVEIYKDEETNKSIGSGFVEYKKPEEAKKALEQCNGFRLLDKNMKVGSTGFEPKYDSNLSMEELDGDEGWLQSAQSRLALMNRLSQRGGQAPIAPLTPLVPLNPTPAPISTVYAPPVPTPCIMLTNMFNPAEAVGDPNFEAEIKEEVEGECSQFGKVLHTYVDKNSKGHVYLKFDQTKSAQKAYQTLNGRWFGGNLVSAEYISEHIYNNRFR